MKNILEKNTDGFISVLDDYGYIKYTVNANDNGLIARIVRHLFIYESFINSNGLKEALLGYFDIPNDTYAYNLTRVKSAFDIGTMTFDDFEEFDESTIDDMVEWIQKQV